ncbi:MAG: MarR family transcriptional regulator [Mobilicoccus sp.]|nr:MarR family transcriptional regulator [Mobilicoccus sp.]
MSTRPDDLDAEVADLLPRAFRGWRRVLQEGLTSDDLAPHVARALRRLHREGPMRPGELAARLRIAPRSATQVVDALEARGLVHRQPDPGDRRATVIACTPAAEAAVARTEEVRTAAAAGYTAALSVQDRRTLVRLLGALVDAEPPRA